MYQNHFKFWPSRLTTSLDIPQTTLYENLEMTAKKYPDKPAFYYYGGYLTYEKVLKQVYGLAGYLEQKLNVKPEEPVLLFMQNSPQFFIAYYAILRARGMVVPINPMSTSEELSFYVKDCSIQTAIIGQELIEQVDPLLDSTSLDHVIVATYSDYIGSITDTEGIPKEVLADKIPLTREFYSVWSSVLEAGFQPSTYQGKPDEKVVLPYTSGTTGQPKGCIHTNETVQANTIGAFHWGNVTSNSVSLVTLPLFHVTGMVHSMHTPVYAGATMVIMTRWNRDSALQFIQKYRCTHWVIISTMVVDFLANPAVDDYDISSLLSISGGGAPLPEAVGEKLYELTGLYYVEGYGLSETISQTHFNPPDRPKLQCLGVPSFDVDARIVDTSTLKELNTGKIGEIVVHGPQVFKGYYNREDENEKVFIEIDGKTFFRTGDIGRVDEEGYFFIVDRLKRMINASGYKVWPTEVESLLYKHPAIQQACVVGIPDERRGESVKAFIILNEEYKEKVSEDEIMEWSKQQMSAYKYPRVIEFTDSFPTTSSGKILWRKLQEKEWKKVKGAKS
ncbi:fatty-acyl-CoA synthase [Salinibacillus kushneri]|uniref:Fatty-acyl-CoA synthase n=1 Tax=Salinibacillus kushneri TaxID=237682 RepID=A0A1I0DU81_9BACI|nr:long-chain fatty acid--CoA ligase [Salinibacillus kushneri]SET36204.1 fatty-acyl-CoA synthase [Salinibacillus kushneri]